MTDPTDPHGANEIFSGNALAEMLAQLKATVEVYTNAATSMTTALLGPAPAEATAVIYTQIAHAVGLAMQNIISQQQTLNTINNAIATKALNLLAEQDPAKALDAARAFTDAAMKTTVDALTKLAAVLRPPS